MFYLSPTLTMLMLTVVPPVSLGAVSSLLYFLPLISHTTHSKKVKLIPTTISFLKKPLGLLRPVPQTPLQPNARSRRRNDQSRLRGPLRLPHRAGIQRTGARGSQVRAARGDDIGSCEEGGVGEWDVSWCDGVEWECDYVVSAWVW